MVSAGTTAGTSAISSADKYTYGPPTVTSVSPNTGPSAGGNAITINGTSFAPGTTGKFGTTAATITYVSAIKLTAKAPAHAAAQVDVTVTTPAGTSAISPADKYTYNTLPTVTSVSPNTGPTAGGTTVTITGKSPSLVPGLEFAITVDHTKPTERVTNPGGVG